MIVPPGTLPEAKHAPVATDERVIAITSVPAGARVLVNNRMIGRAPLELLVKVTPQGFCADYVTVKASFVAEDPAHVSQTIATELTPREKAPTRIEFTPEDARWRLQ